MTDTERDDIDLERHDGRALDELRPCVFVRDFTEFAAGSVLAVYGRTKVLCTASVDEDVPRWMRGTGRGWVTAEYSLLPGSSPERVSREATRGRRVRPHPRDPAPHRPCAAQRRRPRAARRKTDPHRLRCAPGRRWDEDGLRYRAPTSPSTMPARDCASPACSGSIQYGRLARPFRSGSWRLSACWISTTWRTRRPKSTSTSS